MTDFFAWLFAVLRRASSDWWTWVWENFGQSTLIAIGLFVVSYFLYPKVIARWPSLKVEGPMSNLAATGFAVLAVVVLAAIVFIFLLATTPSKIHSDQRQELRDTRTELKGAMKELKAAQDKSMPNLQAKIGMAIFGDSGEPAEIAGKTYQEVPILTLAVDISNTGAPSIAVHWRLVINVDGKEVSGNLMFGATKRAFTSAIGPRLLLDANQELYNKVVNDPIQTGAAQTGVLSFGFPAISMKQLMSIQASDIHLFFTDVMGREYEADADISHATGPTMVPGLRASFLPSRPADYFNFSAFLKGEGDESHGRAIGDPITLDAGGQVMIPGAYSIHAADTGQDIQVGVDPSRERGPADWVVTALQFSKKDFKPFWLRIEYGNYVHVYEVTSMSKNSVLTMQMYQGP